MSELRSYALEIAAEYKRRIMDSNAVATGQLLNFPYRMVEEDGRHYVLYFNLPKQWAYVEGGRKPGKFPPLSAIIKWIEVKRIVPRPDSKGRVPSTKQLAFLIGRKIYRDGIVPRPLLTSALAGSLEPIQKMMDTIGDYYVQDVRMQMADIEKEVAKITLKL